MLRSVKRDSKVSVCKVVVVLLSTYGPSALKTLRALAPGRNRGALWLKSSFLWSSLVEDWCPPSGALLATV
jgi:hypothetical protein